MSTLENGNCSSGGDANSYKELANQYFKGQFIEVPTVGLYIIFLCTLHIKEIYSKYFLVFLT